MNKQEIDKAIEILNYYTPIGATNAGFKPKEEEIHEDTKAFNLAISALEKQIAEKPVRDREYTLCPNCKKVEIDWLDNYCHGCGQRLDWSVEE